MRKQIKLSKMYFFKSPLTNEMELCFPVERKLINDNYHIGAITEVGGDVFWVPEIEVFEPHAN